ncbi:PorV/PorQ family protein [candidate division KSB1 bacterium]|nr:PorV/PorQ family protein [candidate division KSB1 bacterium]
MRRSIASLLIVVLLIPALSFAIERVGTTMFQVLKMNVGVRGIGMGNAFVAGSQDATSIFWNPAGLGMMTRPEAVLTHINMPAEVNYDVIGLAYPFAGIGTFGISIAALYMDDMMVRTPEMPNGTGEMFTASDFVVQLSYSRQLSTLFSFGVTGKYIREDLYDYSASGIAFDAGLHYQTGFRGMKMAMVIANFGPDQAFDGEYQDWRTVSGQATGVPEVIQMEKHLLPMIFRVGVFGDLEQLTGLSMGDGMRGNVGLQFEHPSDVAERVNVGAEFWFQNLIAIRGGYNINYDTETFTAGLGFIQELAGFGIKLDYAYAGMGDLTDTSSFMNSPHRFSLGIQF